MSHIVHPLNPYGVASVSRPCKIIGLFCKRALWNRWYAAKETYNFKEPTNRSHPIPDDTHLPMWEWVISRIWINHVTRMNESSHAEHIPHASMLDHTPVPMWKIIHLFPCERSYTCSHVRMSISTWAHLTWDYSYLTLISRELFLIFTWENSFILNDFRILTWEALPHVRAFTSHLTWNQGETSALSHGRSYLTWEHSYLTLISFEVFPCENEHSHTRGLTLRETIHISLWEHSYGLAMTSRLLKNIGLFCKM